MLFPTLLTSFVCLLVRSFLRLFVRLFVCSFVRLFVYSFVCSFCVTLQTVPSMSTHAKKDASKLSFFYTDKIGRTDEISRADKIGVTTTNSTKIFDVLTGHRRTRTSVSTPKPTLLASLPIVMLIATFRIDKLMRYFVVDEFKWSSSLASKCSVKIAENFNHSIIGADVCS